MPSARVSNDSTSPEISPNPSHTVNGELPPSPISALISISRPVFIEPITFKPKRKNSPPSSGKIAASSVSSVSSALSNSLSERILLRVLRI